MNVLVRTPRTPQDPPGLGVRRERRGGSEDRGQGMKTKETHVQCTVGIRVSKRNSDMSEQGFVFSESELGMWGVFLGDLRGRSPGPLLQEWGSGYRDRYQRRIKPDTHQR